MDSEPTKLDAKERPEAKDLSLKSSSPTGQAEVAAEVARENKGDAEVPKVKPTKPTRKLPRKEVP